MYGWSVEQVSGGAAHPADLNAPAESTRLARTAGISPDTRETSSSTPIMVAKVMGSVGSTP